MPNMASCSCPTAAQLAGLRLIINFPCCSHRERVGMCVQSFVQHSSVGGSQTRKKRVEASKLNLDLPTSSTPMYFLPCSCCRQCVCNNCCHPFVVSQQPSLFLLSGCCILYVVPVCRLKTLPAIAVISPSCRLVSADFIPCRCCRCWGIRTSSPYHLHLHVGCVSATTDS